MPRRRFLIFVGLGGTLVASVIFFMQGTVQNKWLPDWIEEVKPTKSERLQLPSPVTRNIERFSEQEVRKMPINYPEFTRRMKVFLNQKTGWNTYPNSGPPQGWVMESPSDTKVISVIPQGAGVTVYSSRLHKLSWFEKAQISIRRIFSAKE